MKTEKELKEDIKEVVENAPSDAMKGLMLIKLNIRLKTLQERNAEVKKVIEDIIDTTTIIGISYEDKKIVCKHILQKLGLEDGK